MSSTSSEQIRAVRDRPNRKFTCEVASGAVGSPLPGVPALGVGCACLLVDGGVLRTGGCVGCDVAAGVVVGCGVFALCNGKPGVGSKLIHPKPGKYACTQLWASLPSITHTLRRGSRCPRLKPLAIRVGIPNWRAIVVIAVA